MSKRQVHVSHASCDHDKTPAARARCRRIRRGGAPETSKAQIVARVKKAKKVKIGDAGFTGAKFAITDADQQREVQEHYANKVFSSKHQKNLTTDELVELLDDPPVYERFVGTACEQDDVKVVQVNVIAKGSKVVHTSIGSDDAMLFACTKRPINVDSAKITTNDVTCKNCLKITK